MLWQTADVPEDRSPAGEPASSQVEVGPFIVDDLSSEGAVTRIADLAERFAAVRPVIAYALHVGGLNNRSDSEFVVAMRRADVVYADGGSIVLLARLAGAKELQRAPTTDIGWALLLELGNRLGRPARVALVGGADGLAGRAGRKLEDGTGAQVVLAEHGYHEDWSGVLNSLQRARPDIVLVGLGAPREMKWVERHRRELPPALVLSCGGWFGHIVGEEARAPAFLRRSGLEWIARLAQAPRRLAPRYARGALSTVALAAPLLLRPRRHR
jgi:N-acetylglucosaminyldiphosphoundecaprenol N-acetyl-beta-D-mannosaminyltransferase